MEPIDPSRFIEIVEESIDGLAPGTLTLESDLWVIPTWDSLARLNLISAVEEEWGIDLSLQALAGCTTVGDVLRATGGTTRESA